jgi:3-hydroxyacyl-CoA dehydrogenase
MRCARGLVRAIEEADGDAAVKAVVILCEGNTFFAGADISEFGTPKAFAQPMLPQVVDIIENCTKPVVAAIHGTAFGGGLEVALASHYRVAVPGAKLGVPEVKLGPSSRARRDAATAACRRACKRRWKWPPPAIRSAPREAYEVGLLDKLIEGDLGAAGRSPMRMR